MSIEPRSEHQLTRATVTVIGFHASACALFSGGVMLDSLGRSMQAEVGGWVLYGISAFILMCAFAIMKQGVCRRLIGVLKDWNHPPVSEELERSRS